MQQQMSLQQFVERIQEALPGLRSVVLYGSAAAGDFVTGASSQDLLLIADQWTLAELEAIAEINRDWQRDGNPVPQLFTVDELASAADVFPVEILDLQQSRQVLFGDDPISKLQVDFNQLRLQLEHELRSKLLYLRQRLLASSGDPRRTAGVLAASLSTFLVLFRASLRLYHNEVPAEKRCALLALTNHVPFDPQPLLTMLEYKERRQLPETDVSALAGNYLATVEQVVLAVDRHIREANEPGERR